MKGFILSISKKNNLRIQSNYWGITPIAVVAKDYNALLRNRIQLEIENF